MARKAPTKATTRVITILNPGLGHGDSHMAHKRGRPHRGFWHFNPEDGKGMQALKVLGGALLGTVFATGVSLVAGRPSFGLSLGVQDAIVGGAGAMLGGVTLYVWPKSPLAAASMLAPALGIVGLRRAVTMGASDYVNSLGAGQQNPARGPAGLPADGMPYYGLPAGAAMDPTFASAGEPAYAGVRAG